MKKQRIISHRGKVKRNELGNDYLSFNNVLKSGYGIETDIRDFNGKLYICHDIANKEPDLSFDFFLDLILKHNNEAPIALNIKTAGAANLLNKYKEKLNQINYFFFDMAIPDHINFSGIKLVNAARVSEIENFNPKIFHILNPEWIWYDSLLGLQDETWLIGLKDLLKYKLKICIVSSELHGNDPYYFWEMLKSNFNFEEQNLFICTDLPNEVFKFLNNK